MILLLFYIKDNKAVKENMKYFLVFKYYGVNNTDDVAIQYFKGKLKLLNIVNGAKKINLIPIKKDDVVQMYDTITNKYFINKGTGTFIGGEIVGYIKDDIVYNNDGTSYIENE